MTKFILAGGYITKAPDGGRAFCEELLRDRGTSVKVLECLFARYQEHWDEAFQSDREFFKKYAVGMEVDLQLARYDTFIDQVKWADIIYFRGGSSSELVKALQERPEWKNYIDGKTVAGTSAGADALSKYYYGLDDLEVREGLGLVPVKFIPHFRSDYHGWEFDWDKALAELKSYKEDLPIITLGEGVFEVVTQ